MLTLIFLFLPLAVSRVCQSRPPTTSLQEELRLCRRLNYAFCIEASVDQLRKAQTTMGVSMSTSTSDTSSLALVADWHLVELYQKLIDNSEPSQACLHFWTLAVCSETFSNSGQSKSLCYNTCEAVRSHCTFQFVTEHCSEVLKAGPAASTGCSDYATLTCNESCERSTSHHNSAAAVVPTRSPSASQHLHHLRDGSTDDDDDEKKRRRRKKNGTTKASLCSTLAVITILASLL